MAQGGSPAEAPGTGRSACARPSVWAAGEFRSSAAQLADVDLADTVAIGDGANDLDMIEAAGLGIAFNAKPKVAAAAATTINTADLSAVLLLMGIPG